MVDFAFNSEEIFANPTQTLTSDVGDSIQKHQEPTDGGKAPHKNGMFSGAKLSPPLSKIVSEFVKSRMHCKYRNDHNSETKYCTEKTPNPKSVLKHS